MCFKLKLISANLIGESIFACKSSVMSAVNTYKLYVLQGASDSLEDTVARGKSYVEILVILF